MEDKKMEDWLSLIMKKPAEFIGTLKSDDGKWKPDAWDSVKAAAKKFADDAVAPYEKKLKKAEEQGGRKVRERMVELEKSLQPMLEKYDLEKSDKLEDTFKTLVEKAETEAANAKDGLKPEEIRKLEWYRSDVRNAVDTAVDKATSEQRLKYETLEKDYSTYKAGVEKGRVSKAMLKATEAILKEAKADFPEDITEREAKINRLNKLISLDYNVRLDDNDNPVIVNKDGEPLRNDSHLLVEFSDVVMKESKFMFGFNNYDKKQKSPGTPPNKPPSGGQWQGTAPTDEMTFMKALRGAKSNEERAQIREAYEKAQEAAAAS